MGVYSLIDQSKNNPDVVTNQSPNSTILHLNSSDGSGEVRLYTLCPGILFSFNQVYASCWPAPAMNAPNDVLLINYCITGRCEVVLDNNSYVYLTERELSITCHNVCQQYEYPNRHYEGIEFFIDLTMLTNTPKLLNELSISIQTLCEYYTNSSQSFSAELDVELEQLFFSMWKLKRTGKINLVKLKALEILCYLSDHTPLPRKKIHTYYTSTQIEIAKTVRTIISADLKKHYTARELSSRFGISETSLKNYFRGVYGQNISVYIRKLRLDEATRLLEQTQNRIADIAAAVGYENQSKFAAVFKDTFQVSPLEYRKKIHLEKIQLEK